MVVYSNHYNLHKDDLVKDLEVKAHGELPIAEYFGCLCYTCIKEKDLRIHNYPVSAQYMIVCGDCGNNRCPKAAYHRFKCTRSNVLGQMGELE